MAEKIQKPRSYPIPLSLLVGLFILSSATLAFEINLTRLFSVSQFYHFAFMIVSIALLGYGASGSILSIIPGKILAKSNPNLNLSILALATGVCIIGSYVLINRLPFDSFSVFLDRKQIAILILHYVALATPFFFSGMAVGMLLTSFSSNPGRVYSANLLGSAFGCIFALVLPVYMGAEGVVLFTCALAAISSFISLSGGREIDPLRNIRILSKILAYLGILILISTTSLAIFLHMRGQTPDVLRIHLSPYKSLSYALQYPGSELTYQRWNSYSRIDLVNSPGIRSLPGLSIRYMNHPPAQDGLLVDGEDLNPVIGTGENHDFAGFLAPAVAYIMRQEANALILEPRGGLDLLTALALGAQHITAVEINPLIIQVADHIYSDLRIDVVVESERSFLRSIESKYDIIQLSLINSYHPVRSGDYSLAENYRYTVEAFQDALNRLNPDGFFIVTRWLQNPPSESLRSFALAVTALENSGLDPVQRIVVLRSYNTATMFVKLTPFTPDELKTIYEFASEKAFDVVYAPGVSANQVNQYNVLKEPIYWSEYSALLYSEPRKDYYREYEYDISPTTDNRPFFGDNFKWSQIQQVIAELGKFWQPFGGAGYLVILALLIISTFLAGLFIILPVVVARNRSKSKLWDQSINRRYIINIFIYFSMLGLAYLFIEIPLIQKYILYLGHPAYALTTVLFTILFFSGIGSRYSNSIPIRGSLLALCLILLLIPIALPALIDATLGYPQLLRFLVTIITLAPIGFLMGIPFPSGLRWISALAGGTKLIPWVWAINGSASVISAILSALLAISFGFNLVFVLGAVCYSVALFMVIIQSRIRSNDLPRLEGQI
jgi:hypothetical protein